jgi:tRNA(fMet)-specific endonuclease VapC
VTAERYRYLLDTNIVSEVVRNPQGPITRRIARVGETRVCTSIVVACERRYGAAKRGSTRLSAQLEQVLAVLPILALEAGIDRHYGDIRADLERKGAPIGPNDLLIASQARALGLILVTDNVREFGRVERLEVKNWLGS